MACDDDNLAGSDEPVVRRAQVWTVGRLGKKFGLSRTALLYYDRIGLLPPDERSRSGFRLYGPEARERLARIIEFRRIGLPLTEIRTLLDKDGSRRDLLERQLLELDGRVRKLEFQRENLIRMLAKPPAPSSRLSKAEWTRLFTIIGMTGDDMWRWHAGFERSRPLAHAAFLSSLDLDPPEIEAIRCKSRRLAG